MDLELIVLDIEGCIKPGDRSGTDLEHLQFLQDYCEEVNRGRAAPVILLTGRPAPYCEAVIQDIGALGSGFGIPSVAENGGIYWSHNDREVPYVNPALEGTKDSLDEIREIVEELKSKSLCVEEPGKEYCISLNPMENTVEGLYHTLKEFVEEENLDENVNITHSSTAVDITPKGVSKKSGLLHLLKKEDIKSKHVLGVGDSEGDIEWLKEVGQPATPSNGSKEVKAVEDIHISEKKEVRGLKEILQKFAM